MSDTIAGTHKSTDGKEVVRQGCSLGQYDKEFLLVQDLVGDGAFWFVQYPSHRGPAFLSRV